MMAVAATASHNTSSLRGLAEDVALSDSAWERLVTLLQELISNIDRQFQTLVTQDRAIAQSLPSFVATSLQDESVCRDVDLVLGAGDGDLLDDVALSLILASLRSQAIPKFWACIPRGNGYDLSPGWQRRLRSCSTALSQLHVAHTSLLACLRRSDEFSSRSVELYVASFRVAVQESWPKSFASDLQCFFRRSWQEIATQARRRRQEARERKGNTDRGHEVEEWWCTPAHGLSAPRGPADKVLLLLNPARRPQILAARSEGDTAMVDGDASIQMDDQQPWQPDTSWAAGDDCEDGSSDASSEEDDVDSSPMCSDDLSSDLREVSIALQAMGLQNVWRDYVMRFTAEEVASTVQARCGSEDYKKGLLHQLTSWLYDPVLHWLRTAFGLSAIAAKHLPSIGSESAAKNSLEAEDAWWTSARRVVLQFFEIFVEVRILEAFDMVRDFPDSIPALLDLRRCLARTGRTAPLVKALRQQLTRRLLIAGAHTRDVIKVYIKTIKAMRLVDPRGLLLDAVSAPIRAYLKHRKDTVRCIVTALTEDSDLQLELHTGAEAVRQATSTAPPPAPPPAPLQTAGPTPGSNATVQQTTGPNAQQAAPPVGGAQTGNPPPNNAGVQPPPNNAGAPQPPRPPERQPPPIENPGLSFGNADNEASEEEEDPDSWMPDPIDADPWQPSRQRRAQDVISLLVGIYGSKEMFIKEYKEMLADRLLGSNSYDTGKETTNLELLKTRFGEAALGHCEVMLQDIKDSKRINGNIQHNAKAQISANASGAPFQPPPRSNATTAPAAVGSTGEPLSRPFMAPFSLSGIFGLCLQPQGPGGQPVQGITPDQSADVGFPPPIGSGPTPVPQVEDSRMSVEQLQALILSRHFWPSAFAKEDNPNFKLPLVLEDALAEYSRVYSQIRAKRSLSWQRAHGLVDITVQLADRSLANVVVTPVHLAVLALFQSETNDVGNSSQNELGSAPSSAPNSMGNSPIASTRLSLQEVASRLELPEAMVRKRIGFWVSKGVLREVSAGVFDVQESLSSVEGVGASGGNHLDDDIEHSPGNATTRAGQAGGRDAVCTAELAACEAFAQAMLTQYTSLPLGRLHNFLQMFMMDPPYTQTESQLRDFLTRLCQEGKLEFNGSNYALVKKS